MGLDATIRKLSKAKIAKYGRDPLWRIPGYYASTSEIIYWRNHREANNWILGIGAERHGIDAESVLNGAHIPLDEQDLLGLKVELLFGTTLRKYWEYRDDPALKLSAQDHVDAEIKAIDHLIRVVRRGKSEVFYTASW